MMIHSAGAVRLLTTSLFLLGGAAVAEAHAADKRIEPPLRASGTVRHVHDGDTFDLRTSSGVERIRIGGIDAPEFGQPYSKLARSGLANALAKQVVEVVCAKRDDYRRLVCNVFVGSQDVGLALIEAGLAWHFKRFANEQSAVDQERYGAAEETARQEQRGLWTQPNPVSPWECRGRKRSGLSCDN